MAKKKSEPVSTESTNPNRDAVAKAMEALGEDAAIPTMHDYILEHLNLDMENKVIGVHRHHILRSLGKKPVQSSAKKHSRSSGSSGGDVSLEEIRWIREMVKRHGVSRLQNLVELLG